MHVAGCPAWCIVAELVFKYSPEVQNPFEVDFDAIHSDFSLSILEKSANFAAIASLLREIHLSNSDVGPLGAQVAYISPIVWFIAVLISREAVVLVVDDMHTAMERHIRGMVNTVQGGLGEDVTVASLSIPRLDKPKSIARLHASKFSSREGNRAS